MLTSPAALELTPQQRIRQRLDPAWYPISASAIADYFPEFGGCPAYFKRHHLDRIPKPYSAPAEFGRALHAFIEADLKKELPPRYDGPLTHVEEWLAMTDLYRETIRPLLPPNGASEQELFYDWSDGEQRIQLRGLVDYLHLDGTTALIDEFKTGWKITRDVEQDLQARTYDLLVKRTCPWISETRFRLWPFRFNGHPREFIFTTEHTDAFEMVLKDKANIMRTDDQFVPNPSCSVCPPDAHVRAISPTAITFQMNETSQFQAHLQHPTTQLEAEQVAAIVKVAEHLSKLGRDCLEDWCREHGPVAVWGKGGYYGRFSQRAKDCTDIAAAIEILKQQFGESWAEYVRLDMTKVRPLLETKKHGLPALQALMVYHNKDVFTWKASLPEATLDQPPV